MNFDTFGKSDNNRKKIDDGEQTFIDIYRFIDKPACFL